MEIKIWSDVRCPFCYIGKHKFEKALAEFKNKEEIKISWHSFELDPYLETDTSINTKDYLSQTKGLTKEQVDQLTAQVIAMGKEEGLDFNFETAVVANSFNAHRLIQLTKTKNLDNELEEILFKAHFTDGKNIDHLETLLAIGLEAGLDEAETKAVLENKEMFSSEVAEDLQTASQLGIRSVPFFVFNNKYGISGAQPTAAFLQTLEKAWSEFSTENPSLIISKGQSCSTDGSCD